MRSFCLHFHALRFVASFRTRNLQQNQILSPSFRTKLSNIRSYSHWWIHANSYHRVVSEMEHLFLLLTLRKYYDNKMSSPLESIDFYMMTTGSIFGPACLKFITQTKDCWVGIFLCCVLKNRNHKNFMPIMRLDNRSSEKFLLTAQL